MAAAGTLIADFVSQSSVLLVAAVVATILVVALSTYFLARSQSSPGRTRTEPSTEVREENVQQTTEASNAENRLSACGNDDLADMPDLADHEPAGGKVKNKRLEEVDPVVYCEHIQGEIKRVKQEVATRKIKENLTQEQLNEERQTQQQQLAEIFRLMQEQNEKFGIGSMDEMQEQMKLYGNF